MLKNYVVEVMAGDVVTSHKAVSADSPHSAATKASGRAIRDRRSEIHWVRVTDETDEAHRAIYSFAFA